MKDIFDNINIEFSDEILAAADEAIRMHRRMKLTTDIIFKMFFLTVVWFMGNFSI